MKPVGTSVPQTAGNLLPAFAKGDASGESFQAALAQALLGSGHALPATPLVPEVHPVALPELPVPIEGPTSVSETAALPEIPAMPLSPHPVALPSPKPIMSPLPLFESHPTVLPQPFEPAAPVPTPIVPEPGNSRPKSAISTQPLLESRPKTASSPVAEESKRGPSVFPAAPAPRDGGSSAEVSFKPAPGSAHPVRARATAGDPTSSEPTTPRGESPVTAAEAAPEVPKKPSGRTITKEPRSGHPEHEAAVVQVPLPPVEQATPPSIPTVTPMPLVELPQTRREPEPAPKAPTTKAPLAAKTRPQSLQVASSPAGNQRLQALDALLPADPRGDRGSASHDKAPFTPPALDESSDAAPAERMPVVAKVTVEEVHVESTTLPAAAMAKERGHEHTEVPKREVEPAPVAGRGEGTPVQARPIAHDVSPQSTETPAQTRHLDDAPRPTVPTDRVTLRLPDDAGGGRVQIAVRGDVVHARIVNADEAGTREMMAGLDELRSALTRQGFQETHVRIDSRPAVTDGGWMPAAAGRESAGAGDNRPQGSQSQDRRERHSDYAEDRGPDPRRQQPDGRSQQRSRRERER